MFWGMPHREKRRLQGHLIEAFQFINIYIYNNGLIITTEKYFLPRPVVTGQGAMVLN